MSAVTPPGSVSVPAPPRQHSPYISFGLTSPMPFSKVQSPSSSVFLAWEQAGALGKLIAAWATQTTDLVRTTNSGQHYIELQRKLLSFVAKTTVYYETASTYWDGLYGQPFPVTHPQVAEYISEGLEKLLVQYWNLSANVEQMMLQKNSIHGLWEMISQQMKELESMPDQGPPSLATDRGHLRQALGEYRAVIAEVEAKMIVLDGYASAAYGVWADSDEQIWKLRNLCKILLRRSRVRRSPSGTASV
ncbi:hypothetical protein DRE_06455 [Drechslerella stenobrocha 248]|uniref:Uncharacterized protein n=1 Tax=Drechslerella stenobrocha 248 TaxID=1043628 RepID=W7HXH5_9PEZI|nr:hypothetical protein DRE_06455 [Drechslerella stenobrocha 248]